MRNLLLLVFLFSCIVGFSQNTYYGTSAGTAGSRNSFYGYWAGKSIAATGYDNTYVGYMAGYSTTTGGQNVALGSYAGQNVTSGSHNVSLGYSSGSYITTGVGNIGVGTSTNGVTTTGSYNTYIGYYSGRFNDVGYNNVALGYYAGMHVSSGYKNLVLGDNAGFNVTTGNSNVFVGSYSGYTNTTGVGNVFVGANAGYYETNSNKLYIDNSNVTTPLIYGDFTANQVGINALSKSTYTLNVGGNINATGLYVNDVAVSDLGVWVKSGTNINFTQAGVVSIGTTTAPSGYKLAIGGKMVAEELVVKLQGNWPDYVFQSSYKLPKLSDVENYIRANSHLPDVPSARDIESEGIKVGEMNNLLLKKIEELTLYIIDLEKKISKQESAITELSSKVK